MPDQLDAYWTIAAMTIVTAFTRIVGPVVMSRITSSQRVEGFLECMATSVVAAIVATYVAQNGYREALAIVVAAAVMLITRKAGMAMLAAVITAAGWRLFLA